MCHPALSIFATVRMLDMTYASCTFRFVKDNVTLVKIKRQKEKL